MTANEILERLSKANNEREEVKKLIDEMSKGDSFADDHMKRLLMIADFMADNADMWMSLNTSYFTALICTMIDSYCENNMIYKDMFAMKIAQLMTEK